ncbi:MAG TPA: hypothetical protein VEQ59_03520 [Polyangiaceae bacterium]|nr:hypothetical protein [Polyangiaceae bacterium]
MQRDCAAIGEVCVDGGCRARICEPGALSCYGASARQCSAAGDEQVELGTCAELGPAWHCVINAGEAACTDVYCLPNQPVCDEYNTLRTCNAAGDDYVDGGSSCGERAICTDAACQPKVCEGDYDCLDDKLIRCKALGLSYDVFAECAPSANCVKDAEGYANCEPNP